MVSLLSRGVGILVKSLAGLSCPRGTRCRSLPSTVSLVQCMTTRWFSKKLTPEESSQTPPIDDPPKRPAPAFFRFFIQQKPQLMEQHPRTSWTGMLKLAGTEWQELSKAEKQIYIDAARADLLKYRESLHIYKDKLGPKEWKAVKDLKRQKLKKRKAKRLTMEKTKYGKPKITRSAYNFFMTEHYHEAKVDSIPEKVKYLSREWSVLPDSDKQMYMQLAEDDKVRYETEMKLWEDQMIEIGRQDLIRLKSRVRLSRIESSKMGEAFSEKKKRKRRKKTTSKKGSKTGSGKESPRKHKE